MHVRLLAVIAAVALMPVAARAQGQNAGPGQNPGRGNANAGPRLQGNVQKFEGQTLTLKTLDGMVASVVIPPDLRIVGRMKGSLDAIKAGDFVGSAADEGPDGKLHAEEVHIMDGALRGVGEGHRAMPPSPASDKRTMTNATVASVNPARSMTNATVAGVSGSATGRVLKMQYPGGENDIEVAANTPITRMSVGDASLFKPGAAITIATTRNGESLTATQLFVETDQDKPR